MGREEHLYLLLYFILIIVFTHVYIFLMHCIKVFFSFWLSRYILFE